MLEFLEKAVMTAIGVAAITQKKAEELVSEMKDKYKISEEEGKIFVDRIQTLAKESRDKVREMAELEVQKVVDRLGVVSRDEFDRLSKRVEDLESKLND
ncbi:MAG: phasin superfamily protein [Desulfuromonadales bacterium GWD2_54_10]|nr:MAG: phasin superfamily protein [Desulfuromonadales bacterium GWD2_54_10]